MDDEADAGNDAERDAGGGFGGFAEREGGRGEGV